MTLLPPGKVDATRAAEAMGEAVARGGSAACVTLLRGPGARPGARLLLIRNEDGQEEIHGSLGDPGWDAHAQVAAREGLEEHPPRDGLRYPVEGLELYLEVRHPVPELIIVGAGHIARPLCEVGALLGFEVVVVDDRPDFATRERFPQARRLFRVDFSDPFAQVIVSQRSHILLVTRGHKYDYECLRRVMKSDRLPAYIGMIGSRRRVRATFVQLLDEGVSRDALGAIHAPVGLDVGAETPEEIAVAVAAELVLTRRGGSGRPLRDVEEVARRFFSDEGSP